MKHIKAYFLALGLALLASPTFAQPCPRLCDDTFWATSTPAEIATAIAKDDVNASGDLGMGPLHKAARFGSAADITALVARGAFVNALTITVGTPLHVAAYGNNVETIAALIEAGADVNTQRGPNGSSPLHSAIDWGGSVAHIQALLQAGANMELKDKSGMTPLDLATEYGYPEHAAALRAAGASEGG